MDDVIAGIFKFQSMEAGGDPMGPDGMELCVLAKAWKQTEPGFEFLHVRSCGDYQIGIEFRYRLQEKETQRNFVHKKTHVLKCTYGNNLVGWDIAPAEVIK